MVCSFTQKGGLTEGALSHQELECNLALPVLLNSTKKINCLSGGLIACWMFAWPDGWMEGWMIKNRK